ncbi:MAG: hypothetical protein B0D91_06215 [Oceanospirillales bacterium LUC14_002_19_P2]|nr:MAG: hypothetical protein B0D91_06215 [Oceanospirillales bacterium LUC14_002_19_P2]
MLELSMDPGLFAVLSIIAFLAGFVDAVAGGGGLLMIPALLSAGIPPHISLGTNKLSASFGSFMASLTFYRKGIFRPRFWILAACATAIGATMGTFSVDLVSTEWLNRLLPLAVFANGVYMLLHKSNKKDDAVEKNPTQPNRIVQSLQGLIIGFYDGFAGPGTGSFWAVSNMSFHRLNLLVASGAARAMNFISNIISLLTFAWLGHVNWMLGIGLGLSLMLGSLLGAHSAVRLGSRFIKPVFILVVLAISIHLVIKHWL